MSKILVAYFSASGETARLAKTLARLRQDLTPQPMTALVPAIRHIPGYLHNRVRLLPIEQVEYAFSDLGGVHVACQGELFHTQLTLKSLEEKTPLLRSMAAVDRAAVRVLKLFGDDAEKVTPQIGAEQEYFLINKEDYARRPDLILTGRTLVGAPAPKGQELEDHYFGSLRPRVKAFSTSNQSLS